MDFFAGLLDGPNRLLSTDLADTWNRTQKCLSIFGCTLHKPVWTASPGRPVKRNLLSVFLHLTRRDDWLSLRLSNITRMKGQQSGTYWHFTLPQFCNQLFIISFVSTAHWSKRGPELELESGPPSLLPCFSVHRAIIAQFGYEGLHYKLCALMPRLGLNGHWSAVVLRIFKKSFFAAKSERSWTESENFSIEKRPISLCAVSQTLSD